MYTQVGPEEPERDPSQTNPLLGLRWFVPNEQVPLPQAETFTADLQENLDTLHGIVSIDWDSQVNCEEGQFAPARVNGSTSEEKWEYHRVHPLDALHT